jgi:hypothetical protein
MNLNEVILNMLHYRTVNYEDTRVPLCVVSHILSTTHIICLKSSFWRKTIVVDKLHFDLLLPCSNFYVAHS